jgi:hypothetical protein
VLGSNYFYDAQVPWGSWSEYSLGIDFVPADVIEACTDFGTPERAPVTSGAIKYIAFCDAAGGTGRDSFSLAVAHGAVDGATRVAVLDLVREHKPSCLRRSSPSSPRSCARSRSPGAGDGSLVAYADEWSTHQIVRGGERTTSENYPRCCR